MMKKSLCCALLLTASFSTFAAAKTEQQIADITKSTKNGSVQNLNKTT
ncbi:hypothetical protein C7197_09620 [Salmonella enterica subsp. enterica serovar Dublin]|nr:hypothetical protein [Salmonella enterica subsp. enterica serovar Dublin]